MEEYSVYFMICIPLSLPSFVIIFEAIKKKMLKSVFSQQVALIFLLNGRD